MTVHRSEYAIKFTGLPNGSHEYRFAIGERFFRDRIDSLIRSAEVEAIAILNKGNTLQLDIRLEGMVEVECARCLEPFWHPVSIEKSLLVRQVENPNPDDDDDDAIHIALHAHEVDLEKVFYDYLTLEIPYSPVHPDKENGETGCDPEILKFLAREESPEEKKDDRKDQGPWDALKNIKLN